MLPATLCGAEAPRCAAANGGQSRVDTTRHQPEIRRKQIRRERAGVIKGLQPALPEQFLADVREAFWSGQLALAATADG